VPEPRLFQNPVYLTIFHGGYYAYCIHNVTPCTKSLNEFCNFTCVIWLLTPRLKLPGILHLYNAYPFMERQILEVCTGVGESLQGVCQIERRGEIVAIYGQDSINHRQVLCVVLSLQHSNTHIDNRSSPDGANPTALQLCYDSATVTTIITSILIPRKFHRLAYPRTQFGLSTDPFMVRLQSRGLTSGRQQQPWPNTLTTDFITTNLQI